ncbi:MAG: SGNH/GDSL hydrolase family protein, partial [Actinobacteria bacterium]|nr:SGNH/GDSL hydrolase family protein [Actinomycetota bacterium]
GPHSPDSIADRILKVARTEQADTIVVMAGVNDLWTKPADSLRGTIASTDLLARGFGADVFFVTVPPLPIASPLKRAEAERRRLNDSLLADFPGRAIDCEANLVDGAGHLRSEFAMASDDLHLNNAGEQALADCIAASPLLEGRLPGLRPVQTNR